MFREVGQEGLQVRLRPFGRILVVFIAGQGAFRRPAVEHGQGADIEVDRHLRRAPGGVVKGVAVAMDVDEGGVPFRGSLYPGLDGGEKIRARQVRGSLDQHIFLRIITGKDGVPGRQRQFARRSFSGMLTTTLP